MTWNRPKYRLGFRGAVFFALLSLFGGCKLLDYFKPVEDVCEEPEVEVVDMGRFYDSLQMLEHRRHFDSCEMVLQAEWDSILKAEDDTVMMDHFAELLADSIIAYAREFMNVPYRSGGNGPKVFDCSGFTKYVFMKFGYRLKRTVVGQLEDGWKRIDDTAELRRGDLVFFGGRRNPTVMGHVAIVVDNRPQEKRFFFIHATLKKGVIISASNEKYYRIRYMTACRILPEQ